MLSLKVLLICGVGLLSVYGQSVTEFPPEPPKPTIKPTTSTTKPTTTSSSTTTTTTTTTSTTSTTTTTSKPPTPHPTNATTTTTTTTTSTTPAPPTTTPKPVPVPDPTPGMWAANYTGTNRTCIVAHAALQFEIPVDKEKTIKINLPANSTSEGNCLKADKEMLTLTWGEGNRIEFDFNKTNTSKFELIQMNIDLNITLPGKNATIIKYQHSRCEFVAPLENSYKCNKKQTFNITRADDEKAIAYLHISQVQFEAFRNTTGTHFSSALDCEGSHTDVVPIVVGCVLAGLVIMILVGYLVGRRRCQARGYLSMFSETKTEADYIPMKNLSCFN